MPRRKGRAIREAAHDLGGFAVSLKITSPMRFCQPRVPSFSPTYTGEIAKSSRLLSKKHKLLVRDLAAGRLAFRRIGIMPVGPFLAKGMILALDHHLRLSAFFRGHSGPRDGSGNCSLLTCIGSPMLFAIGYFPLAE